MTVQNTALILGATGGIGHETALALLQRGWHIRALHRDPGRVCAGLPAAEWVKGDAMREADVVRAAEGAALILHGVNPPGYRNWNRLALPMLENSIAAATRANARLVFPGTLYNYGPDAFPLLGENAPQTPCSRKGTIRVAMEERLRTASEKDGLKVLILRAGDFFGPRCGNSWFTQVMVQPGKPLARVTYPGRPEVGHAWAYLPDLGETVGCLVDREEALGRFERFHFAGHWVEPGIEFAERVRDLAGRPELPLSRFPWLLVRALSPLVRLFREVSEVRYLWTQPVRLDNTKLHRFLGEEPHTPIDEALRTTMAALGLLAGGAAARNQGPRSASAAPRPADSRPGACASRGAT